MAYCGFCLVVYAALDLVWLTYGFAWDCWLLSVLRAEFWLGLVYAVLVYLIVVSVVFALP